MADTVASRLRGLQNIVASSDGSLDALLLVGGVDGKNHAGSRECLNWLLNGLNGRDIFGYTKLDSLLDEAVLLITADSARLYATRELWAKLEPRVGRLRRLQVWMPDASTDDDVEAAEAHKIRSFIAMVRGVKSIGVPLAAADAGSGPAAAVEAWPLVQAFALQDFEALTGGGFFTQQHAVSGVGEAVRALLLQLDVPSLAWLGLVESPRLASCLSECLGSIDLACEAGRPIRHSEAELFETVLAYHTHGQLRANNLPKASALPSNAPPDVPAAHTAATASSGALRRVGCLIGKRTALLCSGAGASGAATGAAATPPPEPSTARAGEAGGCEPAPRHMCAELCEPVGPLYAGRTYFLGSGARAPPRDVSEEVEELLGSDESAGPIKPKARGARGALAAAAAAAETSAYEDARRDDSDLLQGLYGCLVAAVDAVALQNGAASTRALCAEAAGEASLTPALAAELVRRAAAAELTSALASAAGVSSDAQLEEALASRLRVQAAFSDLLGAGYTGREGAALAARGALLVNLRVVLSLDGLVPEGSGSAEPLGALLLGETYACALTSSSTTTTTTSSTTTSSSSFCAPLSLSACVPRYEVWRAAGPETEASTDLSSACESAMKITFGHDSASLASGGSLKPKMPTHALVGGLLGLPVADAIDGCALLPSSPTLQPLECTLYPFARGAVLQHARAGSMLLLFDAGLSPRRVELYEHAGTTVTAQTEGDPLLDALQGKKPSVSNAEVAAANAAAFAAAAETERADGLPRESCTLLRLWYTLDQLQSVLGARAGFLASSNNNNAKEASSGGRGAEKLVDFTLALSRSASRRALRREILPQWREQWAKKGTECDLDAQMPPVLSSLPADTILGTWPTSALRAATKPSVAKLAALAAPRPAAALADVTDVSDPSSAPRCVRVLLLTGMPGPALDDAAAAAVELTSGSIRWHPCPDGGSWCDGVGGFDVKALASILAAPLRSNAPVGGALPVGAPEQLLLTTHGFPNDLPSLVAAVASACAAASDAAGPAASVRLGGVVTCIDAPRAFEQWSAEGDVRCAPGLYECLDDGFVQAALVCRTSELRSGQEAKLYRMIATAAPTAAILRAPRSSRSAGTEVGNLLATGELPFEAPPMVAARAASSPLWSPSMPAARLNPALHGMQLVRLQAPPPLSAKRLEAALQGLLRVADGPTPHGQPEPPQVMLAYGTVCALPQGEDEDEDEAVDIADDAAPQVASKRIDLNAGDPNALRRLQIDVSPNAFRTLAASPIDSRAAAAAASGTYSTASNIDGLTFVCRGLGTSELADMLLGCRPLPPKIPHVTRANLPAAKLAELREHLRDHVPLPDDVFHDGRVYVDMDGSKSEDHPGFEDGVAELIAQLNAEVDKANAAANEAAAKAQVDAAAYRRTLAA